MAASYNELFGLGSHPEDAALEGWWKLQETTGTTAVDSSSNGNDGTIIGMGENPATSTGPTSWLPSAYNFDGVNDRYVTLPDIGISRGAEWTMATWFRHNDISSTYSIGGEGGSGFVPYAWLAVSNDVFEGEVKTSTNDSAVLASSTTIADNAWRLGSLVRSASGLSLSLDGVEEDTAAFPPGNMSGISKSRLGAVSYSFFSSFGKCDQAEAFQFSRSLSVAELGEAHDGPEPLNVVAPTLTIDSTSWSGTVGTWDAQSNGLKTYEWELRNASDDSVVESGTGSSPSGSGTYADGAYYLWVRCTNDGGYDAAQDTHSQAKALGYYYYSSFADSWTLAGGFTFKSSVQGAYAMPWQTDTADDATGNGNNLQDNLTYSDGPYGRSFSVPWGGSETATFLTAEFSVLLRFKADTAGINNYAFASSPNFHFAGNSVPRGEAWRTKASDGTVQYTSFKPGTFIANDANWHSVGAAYGSDFTTVFLDDTTPETKTSQETIEAPSGNLRIGHSIAAPPYNFQNPSNGEFTEVVFFNGTIVTEGESVAHGNGPTPLPTSADTLTATGTVLSWTSFAADTFNNGDLAVARDIYKDDVLVASDITASSYDVAAHGAGSYKVRAKPSNDAGSDPIIFTDSNAVAVEVVAAGPLSRSLGHAVSRTLSRTLNQV